MKLDEAVKAIEATGEHIDFLVNNAGLVVLKGTIDVNEEDIDRYVILRSIAWTLHVEPPQKLFTNCIDEGFLNELSHF